MLSRRDFLAMLASEWLCDPEKETEMFADPVAYEQFMGRWSRVLAPSFIEFADVPDGGRVLDVGSGTGALAFAIAIHKPRSQVTGIDPSKEYVDYARSRNRFGPRMSFEVGDAQQLPFDNASFQAALSLLVFNFIPDPAKALREVARVTRPGGRVAAAVWDYGSGMRMLRLFWDAAGHIDPKAETSDERHMPLCRRGELLDLWRKQGLENVEERALDIQMRFASFADYWDPFLLGQGPAGSLTRRLDRARLLQLREELKQGLHLSAEDVPFDLPARAWAVRGTVSSHEVTPAKV